jgi:hypothetical protein
MASEQYATTERIGKETNCGNSAFFWNVLDSEADGG